MDSHERDAELAAALALSEQPARARDLLARSLGNLDSKITRAVCPFVRASRPGESSPSNLRTPRGPAVLLNLFGAETVPADQDRWHQQPFMFLIADGHSTATPSFGLTQAGGGPCGVLAATQAWVIRYLLEDACLDCAGAPAGEGVVAASLSADVAAVDGVASLEVACGACGACSVREFSVAECALVDALACMLDRARPGGRGKICILCAPADDETRPTTKRIEAGFFIAEVDDREAAAALFLRYYDDLVARPGAVLDFARSAVLTRGEERCRQEDMDDPTNSFVGQFGHCGIELVTLLLVGAAVSNLFDFEMELGESGFTAKGVPRGCPPIEVGVLSEMEALRYLEVGSLLKNPRYPVFVYQNQGTHFVVLHATAQSHRRLRDAAGASAVLPPAVRAQRALRAALRDVAGEDLASSGICMAQQVPALAEALGGHLRGEQLLEQAQDNDSFVQALGQILAGLASDGIVMLPDLERALKTHLGLPVGVDYPEGVGEGAETIELCMYDGQPSMDTGLPKVSEFVLTEGAPHGPDDTTAVGGTLRSRWPNHAVRCISGM